MEPGVEFLEFLKTFLEAACGLDQDSDAEMEGVDFLFESTARNQYYA